MLLGGVFCVLCMVLLLVLFNFMGKTICDFFGHDWENVSRSTIDRGDGSVEIWDIKVCKNCKKRQKTHETKKYEDLK